MVHGTVPSPEAKVAEIEASSGTAVPFRADVTKAEEVEAMVAKAVDLSRRRLDILVNNANGSDPELEEQGIKPGGRWSVCTQAKGTTKFQSPSPPYFEP